MHAANQNAPDRELVGTLYNYASNVLHAKRSSCKIASWQ
jgi:hypothetical protein